MSVPAPFSLASNTCAGATVAPNAACTVTVAFTPQAVQSYAGSSYVLSTTSNASSPALSLAGTGTSATVTQVTVGGMTTFVRKSDGTWFATGFNNYKYGNNSSSWFGTFTALSGITGATQLIAGQDYTFAKMPDGSWVAAGRNASGQLGLGDTNTRMAFTTVPALAGALQVVTCTSSNGSTSSDANSYTYAQLADGSWWSTGANSSGQLGLGDTTARSSFTRVTALNGATQVVAGGNFVLARLSTGSWVVTGGNNFGALGLGDNTQRNSFTAAPGLAGATTAVAGYYTAYAQFADGSVYGTGSNASYELGISGGNRNTWTALPWAAGATQLVAGGRDLWAQLPSGAWLAAGANSQAQLGLANTTQYAAAQTVTALAGATQVATGGFHFIAHRANGTWAVAGDNTYGELGLGGSYSIVSTVTTVTP